MKNITLIASTVLLLQGCATDAIYVSNGQAVRLREDVHNVAVWVKTKDGQEEPAKMTLPNGWYALPDEGE